MTKSKIFLATAALLVTVCGAFATKAVNKLSPTTVWYEQGGACLSITNFETDPCALSGSANCQKQIEGVGLRTIFQTTDGGECILPFKTN